MTERLGYELVRRDGAFELRRYGAHLTAEVRVRASGPAAATSAGFNALAGYIFGGNHAAHRIEMTTPVTAEQTDGRRIEMTTPVTAEREEGRRIAMTVPVTAERVGGVRIAMTAPVTAGREDGPHAEGATPVNAQPRYDSDVYVVGFTMPRRFTSLAQLPEPDDPRVRLVEVPAHTAAAVGFGGYLTDAVYERGLRELTDWMASNGLHPAGAPVAAQFDGPWKPAFARHNEIIIPVTDVRSGE